MILRPKYVTKTGLSCEINLGVKVNPYPATSAGLSVNNEYYKHVEWESVQGIVSIADDEKVVGYPSHDMKYFVAIYTDQSNVHPAPQNAVVFAEDGTLHLIPKVPELVSDLLLQMQAKVNYTPAYFSFLQCGWDIDSKGNLITAMMILFDEQWVEKRVFDPSTGVFGACLGSWRL